MGERIFGVYLWSWVEMIYIVFCGKTERREQFLAVYR